MMGEHLAGYTFAARAGEAQAGAGSARMLAKERRPYETKDGYVCILVYNAMVVGVGL